MSDDPTQPLDELARWLRDDVGDNPSMPSASATAREHPRRSSLRQGTRATALVAPWLIVIAVLAAPLRTMGSQPTGTAATQPSTPPAATPTGTGPPAPAGAAATATRLARDAVTRRHAGGITAVDVAVPEDPRWLGSGVWMVRVHAVVLHGDARRWRSATHEIWAVPVGARGGRLVGLDHPWRVATGGSRIAPARWEPAAIDEAAVRSALHEVGAQPADDMHPEQHPEVEDIIRVRVAGGAQRRHVWLRTAPTIRVLGAPPAAHAERLTTMPADGATP